MSEKEQAEYQVWCGFIAAMCFVSAIALAVFVKGWLGISLACGLGILGFVFMYETGRKLD